MHIALGHVRPVSAKQPIGACAGRSVLFMELRFVFLAVLVIDAAVIVAVFIGRPCYGVDARRLTALIAQPLTVTLLPRFAQPRLFAPGFYHLSSRSARRYGANFGGVRRAAARAVAKAPAT